MKKAAVYIRVSTTEQANEGVSLDAQLDRARAYCTLSGLELVAVLREEGVSASKPLATRPLGSELTRLVAAGEVTEVVALKLDRLFRDSVDALTVTKSWDKAGVALHLVDMAGQSLSTGSAMGRFFLGMMAGFAELERNLIAERTSAAMQHLKAEGRHVGAPGLGQRMEAGELVANPEESATVARILELRQAEKTLREIAATLTAEGRRTKRGGKWGPETVRQVLARVGAA